MLLRLLTLFQSTPSQRGRLSTTIGYNENRKFQSTPSQRGRHSARVVPLYGDSISIHALAKRATLYKCEKEKEKEISIHALAKRATLTETLYKEYVAISIHALAKRATCFRNCHRIPYRISIHALAKRATRACDDLRHPCCHFNPRPRKEGDSFASPLARRASKFQSTPSQRGRPYQYTHQINLA